MGSRGMVTTARAKERTRRSQWGFEGEKRKGGRTKRSLTIVSIGELLVVDENGADDGDERES